jgi:hypothetical protein
MVPVPYALCPSPCARYSITSALVQVDYASNPVASPRSTVADSNVHGRLFAVSRTRRVEYGVLRSVHGRLRALHGRSRAGAARLGACASPLRRESSELIVATGALRTLTGPLCIVFGAVRTAAVRPHRRVKSTRRRCKSTRRRCKSTRRRCKSPRRPCKSPLHIVMLVTTETATTAVHIYYSPRTAFRSLPNFTEPRARASSARNDARMTRRDSRTPLACDRCNGPYTFGLPTRIGYPDAVPP